MIALRPCFMTLALFGAGQLFQFPMQLLDLPTHSILVLNGGRCERALRMIGKHLLNVAVCGNYLE
jgi:hypothetical protein